MCGGIFYFSKMGHISDQDPPLVSISHSDQQRPILLKILRPTFKLLAGGLDADTPPQGLAVLSDSLNQEGFVVHKPVLFHQLIEQFN